MANDGKLYIIITDERGKGSGTGVTGADVPTANDKTKEKQSGLDYAKHRFYSFVESQAKQAINYGINNIGNFTGDYVTQRKVNETVQRINVLANIGTSALAGFQITGSPIGAAAGAVIAIAGVVSNDIYSNISYRLENKRIEHSINQLRIRSGNDTLYDGSRTGD
jgi:hypothetical protein